MKKKVFLWNLPLFLAVSVPAALLSVYGNKPVDNVANNLVVNQSAKQAPSVVLPTTLEDLRKLTPDQIASVPKYDGRNYGIVTDIERQSLPICWAYSLAAVSETSILREGGLIDPSITNKTLDFAQLNIDKVTNIRTMADDKLGLNAYDTYNNGTGKGADYINAARIMNQGRGPYRPVDITSNNERPIAYLENIIKYSPVNGRYDWKTPDDINNIKKLIAQYGGVEIAYRSNFQMSNTYFNSTESNGGDHAVLIVGWDDTIPKDKYTQGQSTISSMDGGWIVKNTWGPENGEDGFFYLSYDSPIRDIIAVDYGPNTSYDNNYYWDGYGNYKNSTLGFDSNKYAAIFPVKKASYNSREILKQISFGISGTDVDVVAKIYKNVEADEGNRTSSKNQPESGTLVDTLTANFAYPGFYTLKLNNPTELENGEYFSVVIQTTSKNTDWRNDVGVTFANEPKSLNDLTYYQAPDGRWVNSTAYGNNQVAQIRAQTSSETIENVTSNDLQYADIRINESDLRRVYRYQDGQLPPDVNVKFNGELLTKDVDYKVTLEQPTLNPPQDSLSDNELIGSGNIKVTGIGKYSGSKLAHYPITIGLRPDVSNFGSYDTYNQYVSINAGDGITSYSDITLPSGWRFTSGGLLQSGENTNNLIYDGPDAKCFRYTNFTAKVYKTGSVSTKKDISKADVSIQTEAYTYTGNQHRPNVTSVVYEHQTLSPGSDYDVIYENNVNASSQARVIVKGKGDYAGSKITTFTINKANNSINGFTIVDNKPVISGTTDGEVIFKYYRDKECTQLIPASDILQPGTYYVKAYIAETDNYYAYESEAKTIVVTKPIKPEIGPGIAGNQNGSGGSSSGQNDSSNQQNQSSDGLGKPSDKSNTINPVLIAVITVVSIVTVGTIAGIGFWFGTKKAKK